MQQITTSTSRLPSPAKADIGADAQSPGDGFAAMLAGLVGLPMAQPVPAAAPQPAPDLPGKIGLSGETSLPRGKRLPGEGGLPGETGLPRPGGEAAADSLERQAEAGGRDAGGEGLPAIADAAPLAGAAGVTGTAAGTAPPRAMPQAGETATTTQPQPIPEVVRQGATATATAAAAAAAAATRAPDAALEQPVPASSDRAPPSSAAAAPTALAAIEAPPRRLAGSEAARRDHLGQALGAAVRAGGIDPAATAATGAVAAGRAAAMPGWAPLAGFAATQFMAGWEEPIDGPVAGLWPSASGSLLAANGSVLPALDSATAGGPPVRQLAIAIERAVTGELRHLTVQLSPEALGSIEIALELDADRRLGIAILAERPETLELLRGDARQLERLLGQQGVALADGELSFGLMSDGRGDRPAQDNRAREGFELSDGGMETPDDDAGLGTTSGPPGEASAYLLQPGRLNLSI